MHRPFWQACECWRDRHAECQPCDCEGEHDGEPTGGQHTTRVLSTDGAESENSDDHGDDELSVDPVMAVVNAF